MSHRQIKNRIGQLQHILCKIDRLWLYQLDKFQFQKIKNDLSKELDEWFRYWKTKGE